MVMIDDVHQPSMAVHSIDFHSNVNYSYVQMMIVALLNDFHLNSEFDRLLNPKNNGNKIISQINSIEESININTFRNNFTIKNLPSDSKPDKLLAVTSVTACFPIYALISSECCCCM